MDKVEKVNSIIQKEIREKGISTKGISDGHHTFRELYQHRYYLFCALCNAYPEISWKSKKHFDEENDPMFPDSFLAGILVEKDQMISYHLPLTFWELFHVPEVEHAPKYDAYTSEDVIERLAHFCEKGKVYQK